MATGDAADVLNRLKALLPAGWFSGDTPNLDGLLSGGADVGALIYDQTSYVRTQLRLSTATDGWLDYFAADFFGNSVRRAVGQSDTDWRAYIQRNLLRDRATRPALDAVLFDNTGLHPTIVEGQLVQDLGVCNVGTVACNAGGWVGCALPCEVWVDVYRGASGLSDETLYGLIESVRPVGVIFWVSITDQITVLQNDQVLVLH